MRSLRSLARALSFGVVLLTIPALTTPARAADGYLQLSGYLSTLGGDLSDDEGSRLSSRVDLDSDVGFGADPGFAGRAGLVAGRHRFEAGGAIFDNEANRSDATFRLRGVEFEAAAHVTSKLRFVEGEYGFAVVAEPQGRLEILGGARFVSYDGEAEGRQRFGPIDVTASASASASGPVPHLGVAAEIRPIERLALRGFAKGFFIGLEDDEGKELDFEVTAGFRVLEHLEVGGGYRHLSLFVNLDDSSTTIDLRYSAVTAYVRIGK